MRTRAVLTHTAQAVTEGALIALLVVGLAAGTTFAAKGGNAAGSGTSSSLSVVMLADANANGQPNWGDTVTFAVSTTSTDKPWVALNCYQGGTWVYTGSAGFFAAYPWPATFTLSSSSWTSGGADCTATLYYVTSNGRNRTLATLGFSVGS